MSAQKKTTRTSRGARGASERKGVKASTKSKRKVPAQSKGRRSSTQPQAKKKPSQRQKAAAAKQHAFDFNATIPESEFRTAKKASSKKASSKNKEGARAGQNSTRKSASKKDIKTSKQATKKLKQVTVQDTIRTPGERTLLFWRRQSRWRLADRWGLLCVFLCVMLLIGGVIGVNAWSRERGVGSLHLLEVRQIQGRTLAFWNHVKRRWGPPKFAAVSLGYEREIRAAAMRSRISVPLFKAMIQVFSGFQPDLIDRQGRIGLVRVTPAMAEQTKMEGCLFDPHLNLRVGAARFRQLLDEYGTTFRALLAYRGFTALAEQWPRAKMRQHPMLQKVLLWEVRYKQDPGREIRLASKKHAERRRKKQAVRH